MKIVVKTLLGLSLLIVLLVSGWTVWNWQPDRSVEQLKPRWAAAPSQFLPVLGMQAHLRDEGPRSDPSPTVLLHGTSASLHTWQGWVQALKTERRVITLDMPGFGLTGPAPDADYRIEAYVRFVLAVADKLGIQRFVLGGNSLGGQVAWQTAVAAPARVDRLILVDAAGYPFKSTSVPLGFRIARIPGINRLMEYTLPYALVRSSVRNVYGDPTKVTPELVDRYFELTLREGNRHALGQRFAQLNFQGYEKIKSIMLPTLILWGGQDRLIPPENAAAFQRDITGSQVVVFETLGHVPHEEDPAATVDAVRRFLQKS
jgi:pimeloyl-ACP methyl ester carboxylesterase